MSKTLILTTIIVNVFLATTSGEYQQFSILFVNFISPNKWSVKLMQMLI